jgi:hypothetical protein
MGLLHVLRGGSWRQQRRARTRRVATGSVQGRRQPVRPLARGGADAADGYVCRDGRRSGRGQGAPGRPGQRRGDAEALGDGGGWREPEVEGAVVVEWWRKAGGRGSGKHVVVVQCRETAVSMAPSLVHYGITTRRVGFVWCYRDHPQWFLRICRF